MGRRRNTFWNRNKFKLSGLVLILPFYFLFQQLQPPTTPDIWSEKSVGPMKIALQPHDHQPPYAHHNRWVKDFSAYLNQGHANDIRQAYVNIGERPLSLTRLQHGDEGLLHGSNRLQHVHAIAPKTFTSQQRVWLTLQTWQGEEYITSWEIPDNWL